MAGKIEIEILPTYPYAQPIRDPVVALSRNPPILYIYQIPRDVEYELFADSDNRGCSGSFVLFSKCVSRGCVEALANVAGTWVGLSFDSCLDWVAKLVNMLVLHLSDPFSARRTMIMPLPVAARFDASGDEVRGVALVMDLMEKRLGTRVIDMLKSCAELGSECRGVIGVLLARFARPVRFVFRKIHGVWRMVKLEPITLQEFLEESRGTLTEKAARFAIGHMDKAVCWASRIRVDKHEKIEVACIGGTPELDYINIIESIYRYAISPLEPGKVMVLGREDVGKIASEIYRVLELVRRSRTMKQRTEAIEVMS